MIVSILAPQTLLHQTSRLACATHKGLDRRGYTKSKLSRQLAVRPPPLTVRLQRIYESYPSAEFGDQTAEVQRLGGQTAPLGGQSARGPER
jgi:hypothetical protein